MVIIEVEEAFSFSNIKSIAVYGQLIGNGVIRVGDKLYEESNQMNIYEVYEFPLIRRACGYKDNYIDIGIRPVTGILSGYDNKAVADSLKGKRLVREGNLLEEIKLQEWSEIIGNAL